LIESLHIPVQVEEVVNLMLENGGTRFLDCTLGAGAGYTLALYKAGAGRFDIAAIDIDPEALLIARIRLKGLPGIRVEVGDYGRLEEVAAGFGLEELDGICADLGQSSDQIEDSARGFSYRKEGNLDMRFDRSRGMTASEMLDSMTESEILQMLHELAQEPNAKRLARAIYNTRPIRTTGELVKAIASVSNKTNYVKTLSRCFMAIRAKLNDEIGSIRRLLEVAPRLLKPGGRLICVAYDSNQDRLCKDAFRRLIDPCTCPKSISVCVCGLKPIAKTVTKHPLKSSSLEIERNSRSRSARVRGIEILPH
jgi:16S rRNA (cytosine1402-N4)-methyltransferase